MFGNRLRKRTQHFKKWAKHLNISAYRIYDRDIPEIPLCVDLYTFTEGENAGERYAVYSLFERPYEKDPAEEDLWLDAMSHEIERILELPADHVISKLRRRQKGNVQYEKTTSRHAAITGIISEGNLKFGVNLTDFLDTGLFLDHRPLRKILTESTHHKRVLNPITYSLSICPTLTSTGQSKICI